MNPNLSIDWLGPWNSGEGNPFLDKEWKPLADPLSEEEKLWNNFVDTGYLLNTPINITPVSKLQKSPDLFEERKEPEAEPSQQLRLFVFLSCITISFLSYE